MVKGLYTAYTGMINEQKRLDVLSNNLANADTNGYKKEGTTSQTFADELAIKIKDTSSYGLAQKLGTISMGVHIGETYTDYSTGSFKVTDNSTDFAIKGDGFFAIAYTDKQGNSSVKYTRDGAFTVNTQGYLVTKDGDYVLITAVGDEVKTIQAAEVVSGTVTSYTSNKNVTLDGTKYEYSKNYTDAVKDDSNLSYDLNDAYTLVLDANGYVIYTDGTAGHNDYVYVAEIAPTGGAKADLEADAYFIDGTNKVVVVDNDDEIKDNTSFENKWYSYNEKSNGKYELEAITGEKNETYTVSADNQKIVENGKSSIYTGSTAAKANNDTIFVVNDDDDVTAYTGIKNVPDITSKTADVTVAVVNDGAYADVVYIYSADMSISGDSGDRVYLLESKPNASVDKDDNKYYEYDAIVNGEITTVKATDKNLKIGLYQNVSYDENGYMDDQDKVSGTDEDDFKAYEKITEISYKAGVLSLGSNDVVLADSYKIFVNDDGDGKITTPSSLAKNFGKDGTYDQTVFVFEDDNDEAVEIYVHKTADKDETGKDEIDAKVDGLKLSTDGKITINLNAAAAKETEYTVALSQLRDSGYVEVASYKVTVTEGQKSGELDISSSLVSGQTYQVTYGDLKATAAYTK